MYGFLDESGAQGVADHKGDYLVVTLVVFRGREATEQSSLAIDCLRKRLGLTVDYEFHRSSNSGRVKSEFLKLARKLDFKFITIAIRKNDFKKQASYARIAMLLAREIADRFDEMKIKMDSNPLLYLEIKKQLKLLGLREIQVRQTKSHADNLVQLADYVVNISAKKAKRTSRSSELYQSIASKALVFNEVVE